MKNITQTFEKLDEELVKHKLVILTKHMQQINQKHGNDWEELHIEADNILIETIRVLGLHTMADAFENLGKWYV